jgi:hypothetical protein
MNDQEHIVEAHEDKPLVFWNGKGYVRQQVMVTTDAEGNQCRWAYIGQTETYPKHESPKQKRERLEAEARRAEEKGYGYAVSKAEQCQWFVESSWRSGQCSRTAVPDTEGGVALCWQHADRAFTDTYNRLQERKLTPVQVEHLTYALLEAEHYSGGFFNHPGTLQTSPLIYAEIQKYLHQVLDGEAWLDDTIKNLMDKLIEQRLGEVLGADKDEEDHRPASGLTRRSRARRAAG